MSSHYRGNNRYGKSSISQNAISRSLHRSCSSSIAAARSALETIDSIESGSALADSTAIEFVAEFPRRRNELSGASTGTSVDEPSEAEIRDAKLELFGPSEDDFQGSERRLSSVNTGIPVNALRGDEWEATFTGPDGPYLKLLRGVISVLLEVHSNRRLRDVWDWQLLSIERTRRKVYAHRLHPGHRFSLALQFLVGGSVSSLKELCSRLAASLGVVEPTTSSPNSNTDIALSAILARSVAVTGTTEVTQYSTSEAASEADFDDD